MRAGGFREDLLARINLWTFQLPGLAQRGEDIEPNLDHELEGASRRLGRRIGMAREVRERFLGFARSPEGKWRANFRDLNAAVTRMSTLAPGGRITREVLEAELARLRAGWTGAGGEGSSDGGEGRDDARLLDEVLGEEGAGKLDLFDRAQLACVVRVCRASRTLSEAGRQLCAVTRGSRKITNDADRLRKYLARFGLSWPVSGQAAPARKS